MHPPVLARVKEKAFDEVCGLRTAVGFFRAQNRLWCIKAQKKAVRGCDKRAL